MRVLRIGLKKKQRIEGGNPFNTFDCLTGAIPRILGFTVVGGKRYVFEKVFDVGRPSADFEV